MMETSEDNITTQPNDNGQTNMIGTGSIGPITWDDATWILTSSFIIFTMQSGFGLLEAGAVSGKNEVNIMVKNAVDVVFGGISYWAVGFGLSFGTDEGSNPFVGIGYFFVDSNENFMGLLYSTFVFQLSFATTATTIVSGAMAERTKLKAYIIFSFVNTLIYCMPAHWEWASNGFLRTLGCVDIAGSGAVHLTGGVSGLVAAIFLKPRKGRYDHGTDPLPLGNPVSSLIGMFMLWWGWLAFNCGSTFGISGGKWKLAAKAAVTTLNSSMGGGAVGVFMSYFMCKKKLSIEYLVNSVLGALVSVTAGCAIIRPWEALIIGAFGAAIANLTVKLLDKLRIDDPVGATAVHGACGIWAMIAVGLFAQNDAIENTTFGRSGVFHGGGFYLLGVQTLSVVCIVVWTLITTTLVLLIIRATIGLRMSPEEERLGADYVEHGVGINAEVARIYSSRPNTADATKKDKNGNTSSTSNGNNDFSNKEDIILFSQRRGSCLSRKSFSITNNGILRKHDKVVPENSIPGEVILYQ